MSELSNAKIFGEIGSILLLIGCLTFISPAVGLLGLVGLILVLIALNGFANYYKEKGIFNNALYGIITFIVGVVVTIAVAIFILVDFLTSLGIDLTNWQSLQSVDWTSIMTPDKIMGLIGSGIVALVLLFIFCILGAYFLRKSLDLLATKTNVKLFGTTGLVLLVGAVLTIVFVGFILLFVGILLLVISFFSINTPAETSQPPVQNP